MNLLFVVRNVYSLVLSVIDTIVVQEWRPDDHVPVQVASMQSVRAVVPLDPYSSSVPYCRPKELKSEESNLGQILLGDPIQNSPYELSFNQPRTCVQVCDKTLTAEDKKKFVNLIHDAYQNHWLVDQLFGLVQMVRADGTRSHSIGTAVGFETEGGNILNNHLHMVVYTNPARHANGDKVYRIVGFEINALSIDHAQNLKQKKEACSTSEFHPVILERVDHVMFTYSVEWRLSDIAWANRWDVYLHNTNDAPIIHWFSIIVSLVIVLFLSAFVATILIRVLYRDIARYSDLLADEEDAEETGWKLVHGDVFRKPAHSTMLAATAGSGVQLIGMMFVLIACAGLGFFSPAFRGSLIQSMLLLWVFMGIAAGYTSSRLYKMFRSANWKMTTLRTAFVFPGVVFGIFFFLNIILHRQGSSAAVPFTTLIILLMLWFGISTPLVFVGAYLGFRQESIELPVRINKIPRQIPQQPWFMNPIFCGLFGGALPFLAMFTELFFLFTSIWQHRFFYLFGFLFLVLIILLVVCAEISISLCYVQLVCEDYNWWWRSFFSSAACGVYVLLYAVYYYYSRLHVTHISASIIYFGYSFIFAYACFIICGTAGFVSCFIFLRKIYASIKID
eukprot:GHVT01076419.1.p1 GENE.GHVT01076419.1~~GHVT01076419.1.p1  ORF type:complete len:618 (-),score=43.81 GHVT01076419.1:1966-3819(-)